MRIDIEWLDAPVEGDPLECRSMARLAWSLDDEVLTRVFDRREGSKRDGVRVPLFPIARWLVTNWWSIFYEPWTPHGSLPAPTDPMNASQREWLQRHCLRASSPGYALPFVAIFSEGRDLLVVSRADPSRHYPATPVEFVTSIEGAVEREQTRIDLAGLVDRVLRRLDGFEDPRLEVLRADWDLICTASPDEAEFCRAAGRVGLDPHDVETWPEGVLEWFEQTPSGGLDGALLTDLLETPGSAGNKPEQHRALVELMAKLGLSLEAIDAPPPSRAKWARSYLTRDSQAFHYGYELAGSLREDLGLATSASLHDLRIASEAACGAPLVIDESAAIPRGRVLAVVGWKSRTSPLVAMRSVRGPTRRFLGSRAIYLSIHAGLEGPRLVTDARTWDQRASRAFAAELLAPRAGVTALFDEAMQRDGSDDALAEVAEHYRVSPQLVVHQLQNARPDWAEWG